MAIDWADPSYYPLAVFLCIVGAGVGVCIAWSIAWQLGKTSAEGPDRFTISNEQAQYMKEVRERDLEAMAAAAGVRYFVDDGAPSPRERSKSCQVCVVRDPVDGSCRQNE